MKLKKFNELNESDRIDRNNGYNILTENVKKCTKELLESIQSHVNDPNAMFENDDLSDIRDNQFTLTMKVMLEENFTNYIREELEYLEYDDVIISIFEKIDSRTTMLLFYDEEEKINFHIPLITTMSSDDMIYEGNNEIKYGVWLNTYVAKKI